MANKKITEVTQVSSVASTDDFYIKTGPNFRRVPVEKLLDLFVSNGFYQKPGDGIPQSDLNAETVTIAPDGSGFVSSKTYSQIVAAEEGGSAIIAQYNVSGTTFLRGFVVDVDNSSALLAFLVPGSGPYISVFDVTDESVTETKIPLAPAETTLSGSTVTIAEAQDNTIYEAGELTSLTIQSIATGASFIVRFSSPAGTATALTMPSSVYMPSGFTVEPYGRCEINVADNFALAAFWPFDE